MRRLTDAVYFIAPYHAMLGFLESNSHKTNASLSTFPSDRSDLDLEKLDTKEDGLRSPLQRNWRLLIMLAIGSILTFSLAFIFCRDRSGSLAVG